MDNLTHSLAGAVLGQIGLKRKTRLALPALIVGANIPDIDAFATVLGVESLALRRGLTHGPIALAVLPVVLTLALLAFDRWRRPSPDALPVRAGWLLALSFIGTLSHPLLDWMNNYGIRFLEPFSGRWFYGDTLFIIDLWIWIALAAGVWLSVRAERRGAAHWRRPAALSLTAVLLYIAGNGLLTGRAESLMHDAVTKRNGGPPLLVVASPVPVTFWQREMLWRDAVNYGQGGYTLGSGVTVARFSEPHNAADPRLGEAALRDPAVAAFLFWSRMPIVRFEPDAMVIRDQRFNNPLLGDRFAVRTPLP